VKSRNTVKRNLSIFENSHIIQHFDNKCNRHSAICLTRLFGSATPITIRLSSFSEECNRIYTAEFSLSEVHFIEIGPRGRRRLSSCLTPRYLQCIYAVKTSVIEMTQVTRNRRESLLCCTSRVTDIVCSAVIEPLRLIRDDQRSDNETTDGQRRRTSVAAAVRQTETETTQKLCSHDCGQHHQSSDQQFRLYTASSSIDTSRILTIIKIVLRENVRLKVIDSDTIR